MDVINQQQINIWIQWNDVNKTKLFLTEWHIQIILIYHPQIRTRAHWKLYTHPPPPPP